ncbi:hypothetical protein RRG08_037273 [Elysia crispata]|uniref:Uncharacterized protein n=1 Tax=Elysia crispata TaxID=231223 RepID=A0AAE1CP18_9GAST|nr:hypothetical protein RRG08_037273 [Elysia crispata]
MGDGERGVRRAITLYTDHTTRVMALRIPPPTHLSYIERMGDGERGASRAITLSTDHTTILHPEQGTSPLPHRCCILLTRIERRGGRGK